jgi:hypothetical protein
MRAVSAKRRRRNIGALLCAQGDVLRCLTSLHRFGSAGFKSAGLTGWKSMFRSIGSAKRAAKNRQKNSVDKFSRVQLKTVFHCWN